MGKKINAAALAILAVIIVACNPSKKYEEEERSQILDYVATNNITVSPDANGIYYIETVAGTGELIRKGDSVGVWYTGSFLNGNKFDDNIEAETPFRFRVGSPYIIDGWSLTLVKMKMGSKANVIMPSKVAYGSIGVRAYDGYGILRTIIPGYTPLLFEMEVVELVRE